jgi:hypothetical protein
MNNKSFMSLTTNGKDQCAQTPKSIYDIIFAALGVRDLFDPCPSDPEFDGLAIPWGPHNYANPPFHQALMWLRKAIAEAQNKAKCSVVLIPARTHNKYFHIEVMQHASKVVILTNNVCFRPYNTAFPLPISLCVYGQPGSWTWPEGLVSVHRVVARSINFGKADTSLIVLPWLQSFFGPFRYSNTRVRSADDLAAMDPESNFLVIMGDNAQCVSRIVHHAVWHPACRTAVVVLARYNSKWFRTMVVPHARHMAFLAPALRFSEYGQSRSITGSLLVCIGAGWDHTNNNNNQINNNNNKGLGFDKVNTTTTSSVVRVTAPRYVYFARHARDQNFD